MLQACILKVFPVDSRVFFMFVPREKREELTDAEMSAMVLTVLCVSWLKFLRPGVASGSLFKKPARPMIFHWPGYKCLCWFILSYWSFFFYVVLGFTSYPTISGVTGHLWIVGCSHQARMNSWCHDHIPTQSSLFYSTYNVNQHQIASQWQWWCTWFIKSGCPY